MNGSDDSVRGRFAVCWTGGSGVVYGRRLVEVLLALGHRVHLCASGAARRVIEHEEGCRVAPGTEGLRALFGGCAAEELRVHELDEVEATPASGSAALDGVVIVPCSMGTLARIAAGLSRNLIERAADVAIKEGRRLVVVPRETPLSAIHLQNMLTLARLGVTVLPAMPGFYHRPGSVEELVDFVTGKVLDLLGVRHELVPRWNTPFPSDLESEAGGEV